MTARFCVETSAGWVHLIEAGEATDRGLDVDRAYCPAHDEPGADLGPCPYCQLPLVPGVGEEAQHPRSAGHDGRLRYFCPASPDALHHLELIARTARHM